MHPSPSVGGSHMFPLFFFLPAVPIYIFSGFYQHKEWSMRGSR
jgi:hypothetical protein